MRKQIAALFLAASLSLGGCAKLTAALDYATSASVSPTGVYIASNTFLGLEASAKNYLRLASCAKSAPPCRDPVTTPSVIDAVHKGRAARDNLEAFLDSHPGALGIQGDYDALNAAIATLQQIVPQAVAVAK